MYTYEEGEGLINESQSVNNIEHRSVQPEAPGHSVHEVPAEHGQPGSSGGQGGLPHAGRASGQEGQGEREEGC